MEQGDLGVVLVGSDVIAQITSAEIEESTRLADATYAGGNGSASFRGTINESQGTIECIRLSSDAGQNALVAGSTVTIQYRPQGTGSGLEQQEIAEAVVERVRHRQSDPSDLNRATFTWRGGKVDASPQA